MSFGTKLDEYRIRYGMNKKVLAERIGISTEQLRRITKGECPPSARVINKIIEVLRLSHEEAADLQSEAVNLRKGPTQRVLYDKDNRPFIGKVYHRF